MTYEQEALWWETHDSSEYAHEFESTEPFEVASGALKVPNNLSELSRKLVAEIVANREDSNLESALNIRLTHKDHHQLRIAAQQKGLGIASLARMWILERLRSTETGKPQTA